MSLNNMLIGAISCLKHRSVKNQLTGDYGPVPATQRQQAWLLQVSG
jgi:hypothetical protein